MQRTGLAILALLMALLTSASLASSCRAQQAAPSPAQAAAQANVTQAAKAQAAAKTVPNAAQRIPGAAPAPAAAPATIPAFTGLIRGEASALAQKYHLVPAFEGATGNDARVTDQSPTAGAPLSQAGGSVRLHMTGQDSGSSLGDVLGNIAKALLQPKQDPAPKPDLMPDFTGRTRDQAIAQAQEKGIKWTFYGAASDDAQVASQYPKAGTPINAGASVRLQMVAQAPPPQQVPNFVGRTRSEASTLALQYDLVPAFDGPPNDEARVTAQSLQAGTPILHAGTRVRLQIEVQAPPAAAHTGSNPLTTTCTGGDAAGDARTGSTWAGSSWPGGA